MLRAAQYRPRYPWLALWLLLLAGVSQRHVAAQPPASPAGGVVQGLVETMVSLQGDVIPFTGALQQALIASLMDALSIASQNIQVTNFTTAAQPAPVVNITLVISCITHTAEQVQASLQKLQADPTQLANRLSLRGFANLKTDVTAIVITATATPASKRSSTNHTLVIVIVVIVAASALVLLAVIWLVFKRKRGSVRLVETGGDPKPPVSRGRGSGPGDEEAPKPVQRGDPSSDAPPAGPPGNGKHHPRLAHYLNSLQMVSRSISPATAAPAVAVGAALRSGSAGTGTDTGMPAGQNGQVHGAPDRGGAGSELRARSCPAHLQTAFAALDEGLVDDGLVEEGPQHFAMLPVPSELPPGLNAFAGAFSPPKHLDVPPSARAAAAAPIAPSAANIRHQSLSAAGSEADAPAAGSAANQERDASSIAADQPAAWQLDSGEDIMMTFGDMLVSRGPHAGSPAMQDGSAASRSRPGSSSSFAPPPRFPSPSPPPVAFGPHRPGSPLVSAAFLAPSELPVGINPFAFARPQPGPQPGNPQPQAANSISSASALRAPIELPAGINPFAFAMPQPGPQPGLSQPQAANSMSGASALRTPSELPAGINPFAFAAPQQGPQPGISQPQAGNSVPTPSALRAPSELPAGINAFAGFFAPPPVPQQPTSSRSRSMPIMTPSELPAGINASAGAFAPPQQSTAQPPAVAQQTLGIAGRDSPRSPSQLPPQLNAFVAQSIDPFAPTRIPAAPAVGPLAAPNELPAGINPFATSLISGLQAAPMMYASLPARQASAEARPPRPYSPSHSGQSSPASGSPGTQQPLVRNPFAGFRPPVVNPFASPTRLHPAASTSPASNSPRCHSPVSATAAAQMQQALVNGFAGFAPNQPPPPGFNAFAFHAANINAGADSPTGRLQNPFAANASSTMAPQTSARSLSGGTANSAHPAMSSKLSVPVMGTSIASQNAFARTLSAGQAAAFIRHASPGGHLSASSSGLHPVYNPFAGAVAPQHRSSSGSGHHCQDDMVQHMYAKYINNWNLGAMPWKPPALPADSRMVSHRSKNFSSAGTEASGFHSRLSSNTSDVSMYRFGTNNETNDAGVVSAQLLFSEWEIPPEEIEICKDENGADVRLSEGSYFILYKGILGGLLEVAVKVVEFTKEVVPKDLVTEVAVKLKELNYGPNIVQFHGASFIDEQRALLVFELVQGGNLRSALVSSPSEMCWYARGKELALQLAHGLALLHSNCIVHRNLKSSNILLDPDLTVKIADVGLVKIARACRKFRHKMVSSFDWAAPELVMGQRAEYSADIYSFGVVLWEMCTKEMPIRGALRDVRVPEECPASVQDIIHACMAQDPAKRPTAEQLIAMLSKEVGVPVVDQEAQRAQQAALVAQIVVQDAQRFQQASLLVAEQAQQAVQDTQRAEQAGQSPPGEADAAHQAAQAASQQQAKHAQRQGHDRHVAELLAHRLKSLRVSEESDGDDVQKGLQKPEGSAGAAPAVSLSAQQDQAAVDPTLPSLGPGVALVKQNAEQDVAQLPGPSAPAAAVPNVSTSSAVAAAAQPDPVASSPPSSEAAQHAQQQAQLDSLAVYQSQLYRGWLSPVWEAPRASGTDSAAPAEPDRADAPATPATMAATAEPSVVVPETPAAMSSSDVPPGSWTGAGANGLHVPEANGSREAASSAPDTRADGQGMHEVVASIGRADASAALDTTADANGVHDTDASPSHELASAGAGAKAGTDGVHEPEASTGHEVASANAATKAAASGKHAAEASHSREVATAAAGPRAHANSLYALEPSHRHRSSSAAADTTAAANDLYALGPSQRHRSASAADDKAAANGVYTPEGSRTRENASIGDGIRADANGMSASEAKASAGAVPNAHANGVHVLGPSRGREMSFAAAVDSRAGANGTYTGRRSALDLASGRAVSPGGRRSPFDSMREPSPSRVSRVMVDLDHATVAVPLHRAESDAEALAGDAHAVNHPVVSVPMDRFETHAEASAGDALRDQHGTSPRQPGSALKAWPMPDSVGSPPRLGRSATAAEPTADTVTRPNGLLHGHIKSTYPISSLEPVLQLLGTKRRSFGGSHQRVDDPGPGPSSTPALGSAQSPGSVQSPAVAQSPGPVQSSGAAQSPGAYPIGRANAPSPRSPPQPGTRTSPAISRSRSDGSSHLPRRPGSGESSRGGADSYQRLGSEGSAERPRRLGSDSARQRLQRLGSDSSSQGGQIPERMDDLNRSKEEERAAKRAERAGRLL